jgi:hypothetical protein
MKKKNPIVFGLAILVLSFFAIWILFLVVVSIQRHGPSLASQRTEHRKIVLARGLDAGGWEVLHRDCEFLVTNNHGNNFNWHPPWTNAIAGVFSNGVQIGQYHTNIDCGPLPPAVANLKPQDIEFDVPKSEPTVVCIKLFGMGRTGTWDISYYALLVVFGSTNKDYVPSVNWPPGRQINKVADSIFEVCQ